MPKAPTCPGECRASLLMPPDPNPGCPGSAQPPPPGDDRAEADKAQTRACFAMWFPVWGAFLPPPPHLSLPPAKQVRGLQRNSVTQLLLPQVWGTWGLVVTNT